MVNKPIESYKIVIERFFIFNWQVVTIGLTHWPLSNMEAFFKCVFQTSCIKPYLEHFVCNCGLLWGIKNVNIGSGNGLVPQGNKPLTEAMMVKICVTISHH